MKEMHEKILAKLEKQRHSVTHSEGAVFYAREALDKAFAHYSNEVEGMLEADLQTWKAKLKEDLD